MTLPTNGSYQLVDETPVESDLSELLKADLVSLAESRGLDASGTKADLLERLR